MIQNQIRRDHWRSTNRPVNMRRHLQRAGYHRLYDRVKRYLIKRSLTWIAGSGEYVEDLHFAKLLIHKVSKPLLLKGF